MKTAKRVLLALVLLLVVGGVVVYLYLDRVVASTVQSQATTSLNLPTTLGGASLSLFGGKVGLNDLQIASPQGFSAPHMLTLGKANVAVDYGQLRKDPVHIAAITLDEPTLVIEQVGGSLNFKKAADGMPAGDPKPADGKEPLKLVIDQLTVSNAKVVVRPGLPVLPQEINVPVGTFTMRNVGSGDGTQNGAAVKDVVMQIITALAAQANTSGLIPPELQAILKGDLSSVMTRLGSEAQQRVLAAVPGEAGKALSQIVADPSALTKDPGKALGTALGGLTGGPSTAPSGGPAANPLDDPAKAAGDALGGLVGGKKDKKDKGKK